MNQEAKELKVKNLGGGIHVCKINLRLKRECYEVWFLCKNVKNWELRNIPRRLLAMRELKLLMGLLKVGENKSRDLDQVKCFKDEKGKISVTKEIKERWKNYLKKPKDKQALERMKIGKAIGLHNIPIRGDKAHELCCEVTGEGNFANIKARTNITENQFGLMSSRLTKKTIYLLRCLMEQYQRNKKDLYMRRHMIRCRERYHEMLYRRKEFVLHIFKKSRIYV
ncbi:hypothetical protein CR513_47620, partial [Mucuna pruriens]